MSNRIQFKTILLAFLKNYRCQKRISIQFIGVLVQNRSVFLCNISKDPLSLCWLSQEVMRLICVKTGFCKSVPGPGVDAGHLKSVMPGARVGSLSLRPRTNAVAMRFAILPSAAVCATVVEIKATTIHHGLGGGSGASGPGRRGRRVRTRNTVHLVLLLHFYTIKDINLISKDLAS
jgi:hypothetical protein